MDVLLAVLSPALTKILEVSFFTGYLTAYRLEAARQLKGGVPLLPRLQSKTRRPSLRTVTSVTTPPTLHRSASSSGGSNKALPNDPQRQGNIWHRYEQLENATKSLSNVNQQLVDERARHKKEKKRLEDTIMELRMQSGQYHNSRPDEIPTLPISEESQAVMRELDAPEDSKHLVMELSEAKQEIQRMTEEMSDANNQLEFLRSENQSLAAEISALQRRGPGEGHGRRKSSLMGSASQTRDGPSVATFADEVATAAAAKRGLSGETTDGVPPSIFATDAEVGQESLTSTRSSSELNRAAALSAGAVGAGAPAQVAALQTENKLLKDKLASLKSGGAAAGSSTALVMKLQEQNKTLAEEVQRLQTKMLRLDQEPGRNQDLEEKYSKLLEENTRLQSKVVRLNLGAPPVGSGDASLLEELRVENAELKEDNDKLVAYLESLERKKKDLEESAAQAQLGQGGASPGAEGDQSAMLKSENKRLADEVGVLQVKLNEMKMSSAIPIPVHVETGDEVDKDLWMLVEDLRDQNRNLIEQLDAVTGKVLHPKPSAAQTAEPKGPDKGEEVEELQRQLAAALETRAAEINDDNIRLVNQLSEENTAAQRENLRLMRKLETKANPADAEVLHEAIRSNERLLKEKRKIEAECRNLAEKNTRLISENESLKTRASFEHLRNDSLRSDGSLGSSGGGTKPFFSVFSKNSRKK